jgi:hypothetical protein
MSRHVLTLRSAAERALATQYIAGAATGSRVEFKGPRRTNDQNSLMWSHLSDIARALPWHGQKLTADDWKIIFLDSLKRETRMVPNLDGDGVVNLGRSSSDLSKQEFSDLLELIKAFGAKHEVRFIDDPAELRMAG